MLSKEKLQQVILSNIFQLSTPVAANKIAQELDLAPGSVILGERPAPNKPAVITVKEDGETRHIQIAEDGRSIVFVNP